VCSGKNLTLITLLIGASGFHSVLVFAALDAALHFVVRNQVSFAHMLIAPHVRAPVEKSKVVRSLWTECSLNLCYMVVFLFFRTPRIELFS
jgi:hypothetical protein